MAKTTSKLNLKLSCWGQAAACTDRVVGHRGGDVEDAAAAAEGGAEGVGVQDVGAAQGQPLVRALQREQVRVLAVLFIMLKCMHAFRDNT
jgi:hypothetical protein